MTDRFNPGPLDTTDRRHAELPRVSVADVVRLHVLVVMRLDPDRTEHVVPIPLRSQAAWERARHREGWPSMRDAPMMWGAWVAHHALTTGATATPELQLAEGTSYAAFEDALDVAVVCNPDGGLPDLDADVEGAPVDPTRQGQSPG